jgi:hypothetical protein
MDNYKTIEERVSTCSSFNGNSLKGFWDGDTYKVYSYNTLIATNGDAKWISPVKYSQTTSRQQNLIKRAWDLV